MRICGPPIPGLKELVAYWWKECEVGGWKGFRFVQKLAFIKMKLKSWNKSSFSRFSENMKWLWSELQIIDGAMEDEGGRSDVLVSRRREVLREFEQVIKAEEIFSHQKAKCKWLKKGDGNTSDEVALQWVEKYHPL